MHKRGIEEKIMELPTEEAALAAVEEAKAALATALDVLRQVRGEPADEDCRRCSGTGKDGWAKMMDRDEPCNACAGTGRQKRTYPWIVTGVKWEGSALVPSLYHRNTTWVKVRPCDPECGDRTYLGWLLGDIAQSQMVLLEKDGALKVCMAMHNPAIFVPDLGRVVFGSGSWWSPIETPDDLRTIANADIRDVWYVRALQDLTRAEGNGAAVGH